MGLCRYDTGTYRWAVEGAEWKGKEAGICRLFGTEARRTISSGGETKCRLPGLINLFREGTEEPYGLDRRDGDGTGRVGPGPATSGRENLGRGDRPGRSGKSLKGRDISPCLLRIRAHYLQ